MLTAESECGACQRVEPSSGLEAEEVPGLRTAWPLPLSAGPLRPRAPLSAPCSFWKGPCSRSIPISAFRKPALCSGGNRALPSSLHPRHSWLPPASVWACYSLRPLQLGPPSSLLSARSGRFSLPGWPSPQAFHLQASGLPLLKLHWTPVNLVGLVSDSGASVDVGVSLSL